MIPRVSVLMPVYNCEAYIKESVESILTQSFTDFEFLIIDDHSQDGTYEYLQTLTDPRVKLVRKPVNSGYAKSLNMGLDMAKGDYVARMDGDDIALPERFQRQVAFMDQYPGVVVAGTCYKLMDTSVVIHMPLNFEAVKIEAIMQVPVAHPTVFMRRSVLIANSLRYNEKLEPAEDYDLWTRVMEFGRIENLPEVLLLYRRHSAQESITKIDRLIEAAVTIRERQLNKLLQFPNKPYDLLFAIAVLTKQSMHVSAASLKVLKQLLTDMYESNASRKVYNAHLLNHYLSDTWRFYILQFNKPQFKDAPMLFKMAGNHLTRMGTDFYLRSFWRMLKY